MSMRYLHICVCINSYVYSTIVSQIITNGLNIFIYTFFAMSLKTKRNLLQNYFFAIKNQNLMENPLQSMGLIELNSCDQQTHPNYCKYGIFSQV